MKDEFRESSATWPERYNKMKQRHGWTNKDVSRITGLSEPTIRSSVIRVSTEISGTERRFPPWLKLAIVIDEMSSKS